MKHHYRILFLACNFFALSAVLSSVMNGSPQSTAGKEDLRNRLQQEIGSRQKDLAKFEKQREVLSRFLKSDDLLIMTDEPKRHVIPLRREDISKASEIIFLLEAMHGSAEKSLEDIEKELLNRDAALRSKLRTDLLIVEQWIKQLNTEIQDRQRRLEALPPPPVVTGSVGLSYHLFTKLDLKDSKKDPPSGGLFSQLSIRTSWDKVPRIIAGPNSVPVSLKPGQKVILAGNAGGTEPLKIDNFLYIEIGGKFGIEKYVCGNVETVLDDEGKTVENIAPGSMFGAGKVDLTKYIPTEGPVTLKVYALDYGGVYFMSDIFLIVK